MPDSRAHEAGDSAIRLGILTMSDTGYAGQREDSSGAAIRELAAGFDADVCRYQVIPDERALISSTLQEWADSGLVDLILTTGGTGLSPRDVTPEATRAILDRDAPGLGELMRAEGLRHTPTAALSRAVAGTRARTLIINLPGSERGVRESLAAIIPIMRHAVETLRGGTGDH